MMTNGMKMKKNGKLLSIVLFISLSLGLTSCVISPTRDLEKTPSYFDLISSPPNITLSKHIDSEFLQVNGSFYAAKNKNDIFRIMSDLSLSTQWFDRLKDIETLAFQDNNNFVLRSIITAPWPFKNRELITCVNTQFLDLTIVITMTNCSHKHPETQEVVRVKKATSRWVITKITNEQRSSPESLLTKITYQAWLEPSGYVPASFFNQSLKTSSLTSLTALKKLIEE